MNKYYFIMLVVMAISLVVGLIARSVNKDTKKIVNITSWIVLAIVSVAIVTVLFLFYPNGNVGNSFAAAIILGVLFMASWATLPSFMVTYSWRDIRGINIKKGKLIKVFFYLLPSVFITLFIPYVLIWILGS